MPNKTNNPYIAFCDRTRKTAEWKRSYAHLPVPQQGAALGAMYRGTAPKRGCVYRGKDGNVSALRTEAKAAQQARAQAAAKAVTNNKILWVNPQVQFLIDVLNHIEDNNGEYLRTMVSEVNNKTGQPRSLKDAITLINEYLMQDNVDVGPRHTLIAALCT